MKIKYFVILMIFLIDSILFPYSNKIKFDHITIEDGLSQSTVYAITQDPTGFMYFCTQDGLNRYDGNEFTIYRNEIDNPNSPGLGIYTSIIATNSGNIWIGSRSVGLARFNPKKVLFTRFTISDGLSNNRVLSICEGSDYNIWVGTETGLDIYDTNKNSFKSILSGISVTCITNDGNQKIWIAKCCTDNNRTNWNHRYGCWL